MSAVFTQHQFRCFPKVVLGAEGVTGFSALRVIQAEAAAIVVTSFIQLAFKN